MIRHKCNRCNIDYLPYCEDPDDWAYLGQCFICSDCFGKAWEFMEGEKLYYRSLIELGVNPMIANSIMDVRRSKVYGE
jgi:hypothetical protein